jgi:hypothetical protein
MRKCFCTCLNGGIESCPAIDSCLSRPVVMNNSDGGFVVTRLYSRVHDSKEILRKFFAAVNTTKPIRGRLQERPGVLKMGDDMYWNRFRLQTTIKHVRVSQITNYLARHSTTTHIATNTSARMIATSRTDAAPLCRIMNESLIVQMLST